MTCQNGHFVEDNRLDNNLHIGIGVLAYQHGPQEPDGPHGQNRGERETAHRRISAAFYSFATVGIATSSSSMLDNEVGGMFGTQGGNHSLVSSLDVEVDPRTWHNVVCGQTSTAETGKIAGMSIAGGNGGFVESKCGVAHCRRHTCTQFGIASKSSMRCVDSNAYNFSTPIFGCTQACPGPRALASDQAHLPAWRRSPSAINDAATPQPGPAPSPPVDPAAGAVGMLAR